MLFVETYVAPSEVHGMGLFAAKKIPKGTKIWEFAPDFDLVLSEEDVQRLSEPCRERVLWYAYYNAERMRYILCSDDARFMNHSNEPNTMSVGFGKKEGEGRTIAARDISPDEELTEDYMVFEEIGRNIRYGVSSAVTSLVAMERRVG